MTPGRKLFRESVESSDLRSFRFKLASPGCMLVALAESGQPKFFLRRRHPRRREFTADGSTQAPFAMENDDRAGPVDRVVESIEGGADRGRLRTWRRAHRE